MGKNTNPLQAIYDHEGNPIGVFIPVEVWYKVAKKVEPYVGKYYKVEEEKPEPIKDWEMLQKYWDFRYPVDTDVTCGQCGASTENWEADEPRKFRLRAANLGGLVTFQCQHCRAKVLKRHFKDKISVETQPQDE